MKPTIFTKNGRAISVTKKLTNAKTERALEKWLIEQATIEAERNNDDFNLIWIRQCKPGRCSQSDKNAMNVYLFDEVFPEWEWDENYEYKWRRTV